MLEASLLMPKVEVIQRTSEYVYIMYNVQSTLHHLPPVHFFQLLFECVQRLIEIRIELVGKPPVSTSLDFFTRAVSGAHTQPSQSLNRKTSDITRRKALRLELQGAAS